MVFEPLAMATTALVPVFVGALLVLLRQTAWLSPNGGSHIWRPWLLAGGGAWDAHAHWVQELTRMREHQGAPPRA